MKSSHISERIRSASVVGGLLLCISLVGGSSTRAVQDAAKSQEQKPAEQKAAEQETLAAMDDNRPAEQVYKNIQIMKGMPAYKLVLMMKYFTQALGVRCEHCHVTAPGSEIPGFGAFSKDDLEAKQTARKMINMVASIDKEFFSEKAGPTCWTCHRGSTKPQIEPPPPPEQKQDQRQDQQEKKPGQ